MMRIAKERRVNARYFFASVALIIASLNSNAGRSWADVDQVMMHSITSQPGSTTDLATKGNLVYLTVKGLGLRIYDVTDPKQPTLTGTLATSNGDATGIELNGRYAYITSGHNGLVIADVNDPAHPVIVGTLAATDYAWDVAFTGNTIFMSDDNNGLMIIDATDPAHPQRIKSVPTSQVSNRVRYSNNRVYVSHGAYGMSIINVTDPATAGLIGYYDSPGWANDIQVYGTVAYIADGNRFRIVDITDPHNIIQIGEVLALGAAISYIDKAVSIVGGTDLKIFDVTNPVSPLLLATYNQLTQPLSVTYDNPMIYVADYQKGLAILEYATSIEPMAPVQVIEPNGEEQFVGDNEIKIHWKTDIYTAGTSVFFELWNDSGRIANLGESWSENGETTSTLYLPLVPIGSDYHIRAVSNWDPTYYGYSQGKFTVSGGLVKVMQPNTEMIWQAGSNYSIEWLVNTKYAGTSVWIELWRADYRVAELGSDTDLMGDGTFDFAVPKSLAPGSDYRIRVISGWEDSYYDESDVPFTIENKDYIKTAIDHNVWAVYE